MCIRVRITGIRVRITTRGRITEIVLGCSGHYIDTVVIQPLSTRLIRPKNVCFDLSHRRSTTFSLETRIAVVITYAGNNKTKKRHNSNE